MRQATRRLPDRVSLPSMCSCFGVLASFLVGCALFAQTPPAQSWQPYLLDSGYVDAGPSNLVVVGEVQVPGRSWLQLRFDAGTNLPAGSRVRLRSMRDAAVQWFDGHSLADYQNYSAFFGGDRVEVALCPASGSARNRVAVAAVRSGEQVVDTDLVCGTVDTRVLSNDPRVGRIDGCCTTFLVDARTLVTAGHCLGGIGGQMVHFNVPLSDAAGNPQFPPPQDQYAMLPGSLTSIASGVGNDYAVYATVRNSNTGLYPGQAQGSWFVTAVAPATTAHTVRVTGYGTSGVNPAWSLAQKSDTGPRLSTSSTILSFAVSVTGCNSGSPALHGATDQALGVVTHAGCSATGGSNYGTGFGVAAFASALATLRQTRVAGVSIPIGTGCGAASGVPLLAVSGFPDLGATMTCVVTRLDPNQSQLGFFALGFTNTIWNGALLPADLAGAGLPGCRLYLRPDAAPALLSQAGASSLPIAIPSAASLLGSLLFGQYFGLDPSAANPAQAVSSNAVRITVGN